jgi:WD40 repeat protein
MTLLKLSGMITTLSLDNTYKLLASGDETGSVTIWDLDTKSIISTLKGKDYEDKDVTALAFSPDSTKLVVGVRRQKFPIGAVELWSVSEAKKLSRDLTGLIGDIVWFPTSEYFITATEKVEFRDGVTGQLLNSLTHHQDWINTLAFSPDKTLLASGSGFHHTDIALWSLDEKKLVSILQDIDYEEEDEIILLIIRLTFKNSNTIIFDCLSGIFEWHIDKQLINKVFTPYPDLHYPTTFTDDGKLLAYLEVETEKTPESKPYPTPSDKITNINIHVVETENFTNLYTLKDYPNPITAMIFDKEGTKLIVGDTTGSIYIWSFMIS